MEQNDTNLIKKAHEIRKSLVDVSIKNNAGHIAPSLSCVDILVSLYYSVMNLSTDPQWAGRDRLIFSKAHGCYGLYAILADIGYLDKSHWLNFYNGSFLSGCVERNTEHGLEAGCGSLGHGLPIAVGTAFGTLLQKKKNRIYCVVGDGEMQEGSNWEAAQFAAKYELSNLTVIIDHNKLQAMDFLENVLSPKDLDNDLQAKFEAFGFASAKCNGHDTGDIIESISRLAQSGRQQAVPQVLIADTVKGYGLKCMENVPKFHFRIPTQEELEMGCRYE